jgi:hypothetical protein
MESRETITLYRPVGPKELEPIRAPGYREFPPRLPERPIFCPVLTEEYAVKIARFVTRFRVRAAFLAGHEVREAGGQPHKEYWIPAEQLAAFNRAIAGPINVIAEFRS